VPALSVVAAALTPIGPKLLLAPVAVGNVGAFITEWQPPSFKTPAPAVTIAMIAIVVIAWSRAGRKVDYSHLALLLVATGWTLLAVRTVTLGALLAAPLLAAVMQQWLKRGATRPTRRDLVHVVGAGTLCLAVLAGVVPAVADQPAKVPSGLSAELSDISPREIVINDYAVGGWLRWRHPNVQPLIDGLTEAWSIRQLQDYATMSAVADGWEDVVAQSGAEWALLRGGSPLATALEDRLAWTQVDETEGYVLLRSAR
jgi:hypothetical protein